MIILLCLFAFTLSQPILASAISDLDQALLARDTDPGVSQKSSFLKSFRLSSIQRRGNELWFMVHVRRLETRRRGDTSPTTVSPVFYINGQTSWDTNRVYEYGDEIYPEKVVWHNGDKYDYTREIDEDIMMYIDLPKEARTEKNKYTVAMHYYDKNLGYTTLLDLVQFTYPADILDFTGHLNLTKEEKAIKEWYINEILQKALVNWTPKRTDYWNYVWQQHVARNINVMKNHWKDLFDTVWISKLLGDSYPDVIDNVGIGHCDDIGQYTIVKFKEKFPNYDIISIGGEWNQTGNHQATLIIPRYRYGDECFVTEKKVDLNSSGNGKVNYTYIKRLPTPEEIFGEGDPNKEYENLTDDFKEMWKHALVLDGWDKSIYTLEDWDNWFPLMLVGLTEEREEYQTK